MNQSTWNYINYALVLILIVLAVVIGAMYISDAGPGQTDTDVVQEEEKIEKQETQSKSLLEKQQQMLDKEKDEDKIKEEEKGKDEEKDIDEGDDDEEADNDDDDQDEGNNDDDGDEEEGEVKTLTGVLEEAEEDNEYGGNYKIKLEGNTEYTYLWLSEQMVGSGMIGELVELEVEYQEDGTFIILNGPNPA